MNTTKLKSFAVEARNILKRGVMNRVLALGFDQRGGVVEEPVSIQGGAVFMGETQSEDFYYKWLALRQRIEAKGLREVQEEAAYTWFNRLMAIRIMQMNRLIDPVLDYRSDSVRLPILLTDAMRGAIPAMPDDDRERLMRLLNDPRRTAEQFAMLITAFCHNTPVINRCFGGIADYTELLLPRDILEENGFIDMLNHTDFISGEDYKTPELIGWLYQFYISERKDEVFAKKGKYDPDEIPAATQIFTPNWIVKYMVQNTVGRIYLDNNPYEDELKAQWRYLVDNDNQGEKLVVTDLKDMKVADLACGSGHILNECFDLLLDLYVNEGYSRRDAIESIFANNLTGIDIDTRAKQLATFALLLKACQRDVTLTDAHAMPHVLDMPSVNRYTWRDLSGHMMCALGVDWPGERTNNEVDECFALMEHADSLGSIMKFDVSPETRDFIKTCISEQKRQQKYVETFSELFKGFELILALTEEYSALVMNPPYMGRGGMNKCLSSYVQTHFCDAKWDLFAVFMYVAIKRVSPYGKIAMINMQSWMFLAAFENLRNYLVSNYHIDNLLHLGANTFDEISGEVVQNVAFVLSNASTNQLSRFYKLVSGSNCQEKESLFLQNKNNYYISNQKDFQRIPGYPIAYWLNEKWLSLFQNDKIETVVCSKAGVVTGDDNYYLRLWPEISKEDLRPTKADNKNYSKYHFFQKGGSNRRFYGNNEYVIKLRDLWDPKFDNKSIRRGDEEFYFLRGIGWSYTGSTDKKAYRFIENSICGTMTPMIFVEDKYYFYLLGLLNTKIMGSLLSILNPTLSSPPGYIVKLPLILDEPSHCIIDRIAFNCVNISREDWDAHETSWDFKENELLRTFREETELSGDQKALHLIDVLLEYYKNHWEECFERLHANEEELNRQFIGIYGLQDELTPDVPLDEVTILQQGEISIEEGEIVWHDDVLIKQLISYAVGCWMGRYRLDKPGLHIAHTDATPEELAPYDYNGERFEIDDDGIIPLMPRDSMFSDNAAHRIADFVRQVFGAESQVANLNYMEAALGKSLEQYFIKDFWKDHKKMYQNRPIYWLFSSKKGAFQCLAYMHRMDAYTVERVRQKYLLPHMDDLRKRIADMEERAAELNSTERRTLDTLQKQLAECLEYHDRLHPVADRQIAFDLDDGVVVNHAKFGDILAKLK